MSSGDGSKSSSASAPVTSPATAIEPKAPAAPTTPPPSPDVVLLGPPTADGAGVHVLRAREQRLETGELRQIEEGRPITGEIVTLAPRQDNPRVCDVKDSYTPPKGASAPMLSGGKKKGPAQVATQKYRDNWDEVFASSSSSSRPRSDLN